MSIGDLVVSDEVVLKNDILLKLCEHCSKDSDECILAFQSPCATYLTSLDKKGISNDQRVYW